tara:strand:+ start:1308 stop:1589 length:282 start_codon:yes stop_codon:yes gene_type:complete
MIGKVMIFSLGVVIGVAGLAGFQLRMVVAPVVASGQLEKSLDQLADAVQEAGGATSSGAKTFKRAELLQNWRGRVAQSFGLAHTGPWSAAIKI